MNTVWMLSRAKIRGRLRATIGLTVLLGLIGGAVLLSASGARRTETAYQRLLAREHAPDYAVFSVDTFGFTPIDIDEVARLPQVVSSTRCRSYALVPMKGGRFYPIGEGAATACRRPGSMAGDSLKFLAGRAPRLVDEVAVGEASVREMRGTFGTEVRVGDSYRALFLKKGVDPEAYGPDTTSVPAGDVGVAVTMKVVGVYVDAGSLTQESAYADVQLSQAFDRHYHDGLATAEAIALHLRHGDADVPALQREIERLAGGGQVGAGSVGDTARLTHRVTHPLATALWIFAALAGVAGLLVVAQALARESFLDSIENPTLRALGVTRPQLFGAGLFRAAVTGAGGAIVAVATAAALSPLMPISLARIVEPDPGFAFDGAVLGLGAAVVVVAVMAAAAVPAWRAAGARGDAMGLVAVDDGGDGRRGAISGMLGRMGLTPAASAGVRMALEPGRGRTAVPVRTTMVSLCIALAAVAASTTYAASFTHLLGSPELTGWTWDVGVGNPYGSDTSKRIPQSLGRIPGIAEFSGANILVQVHVAANGRQALPFAWGVDPVGGLVAPRVLEGSWPAAPTEIALGTVTMRDLDVGLGDTVGVSVGRRSITARVVGRSVFPETGASAEALGHGIGMTFDSLRSLVPSIPENTYLIRFAPGADPQAVIRELRRRFGPLDAQVALAGEATDLRNAGRVRGLPLLLAGVLALAGAAALGHALATSVRRRRRDLAVRSSWGSPWASRRDGGCGRRSCTSWEWPRSRWSRSCWC